MLAIEGVSVFSQTEKIEVMAVNVDNFHLTSWSEAENSGLLQLLEVDFPASDDSASESSGDESSANKQSQPDNWAAQIKHVTANATID